VRLLGDGARRRVPLISPSLLELLDHAADHRDEACHVACDAFDLARSPK
jgi:hypothetical protein